MGFEPTTFCLGSKHSTTELRPLVNIPIIARVNRRLVGEFIRKQRFESGGLHHGGAGFKPSLAVRQIPVATNTT